MTTFNFAKTTVTDRHLELLDDLLLHIFEIDPGDIWVSDRSSIFDIILPEEESVIRQRLRDRYGAEIKGDLIIDLLLSIEKIDIDHHHQ